MPNCTVRRLAAALTAGALTAGTLAAGSLATAGSALAGPAPVPSNDARASATPIGALPASVNVNNTGATVETGDRFAATIWYSYVPTSDHTVAVRAQSTYDNTLQVWNGSTLVGANDDGYNLDALLSFAATAGQTYLIGYGGLKPVNQGPGTLTVGDAAPAAPAAPTVSTGDGSADVTWVAPEDNGVPVSGYTVRWFTDGALVGTRELTGEPPPVTTTVTGLTNGTTYTFTVSATNGVGASAQSAASAPATPVAVATAPATPAAPTATAGDARATVTWAAPDNGGAPVTNYSVKVFDNANMLLDTISVSGEPPVTTTTVTGLTNGVGYHFQVAAQNSVGVSDFSADSNEIVPAAIATAPAAPAAPTATAGDGSVAVTWVAPDDGGSPVTSYLVRIYDSEGTLLDTVPVNGEPPATTTTVNGLTNGETYRFTVAAQNEVGVSGYSATSNAVTPAPAPPAATAPATPSGVTVVAGDASANLTWTAPSEGGSAITGYRIYAYLGDSVVRTVDIDAPATSGTISGLVNGSTYSFGVSAINAVGESGKGAGAAVTPRPANDGIDDAQVVPTLPVSIAVDNTGSSASSGDTTRNTVWYRHTPTTSGIISVAARSGYDNGLQVVDGDGGQVAVNDNHFGTDALLSFAAVEGQTYWIMYGSSDDSGAGTLLISDVVPDAPAAPTAVAGENSTQVSWTAPDDNFGPVTSYTVKVYDGATFVRSVEVAGDPETGNVPATGVSVTGLTNGTAYTYTVVANNLVGPSAASAPSTAVAPFGVPAAPTAVTAAASDASATVSWTAPADGGSPITGYTITAYDGETLAGTVSVAAPATSGTVTGLTNGRSYTFAVAATNALGTSAQSALSDPVTPVAPVAPSVPTDVAATPGDASVALTWSAPFDGRSALTQYTVRVYSGATLLRKITVAGDPPATGTVVTGLTNGTAYTFTVDASNAIGTSPRSASTAAVVPVAAPVNDNRANALPLPALPVVVNVDNTGATVEPGDYKQGTIWYSYTPATTGTVGVSALSSYDNALQVWDGTQLVASRDDYFRLNAALSFTAQAGHTYLVGYGSFSVEGGTGPGTLSITDQVPAAPAAPTATFADGRTQVSWTAPDNHGGPLIGYTVRAYDGDNLVATVEAATNRRVPDTTAAVPGLTNGRAYTFTVTARNLVGPSQESARSEILTPTGAPVAPGDVTATAGYQRAVVTWTAPANDGGSPVTSYSVQVFNDEDMLVDTVQVTGAPPATTVTVTGLTNGTAYHFRVTASSSFGTSEPTDASLPVTPGVPSNDMRAGALPLPELPATVDLDNTGATVEAGDLNEGTLWYSYTPTTTRRISLSAQSAFDNTLQVWDGATLVASNDDSWNLNALLGFTAEAGHTYLIAFGSFDTAEDGSGGGTLTVSDAPPAAPAAPTVAAGERSALVSWMAPADNGGPITGYTVRAYAGDTLAGTVQVDATDTAPPATTAIVGGLTGGIAYTFTVTANNLIGASDSSARSAATTPTGVPLAPTGVQAVAGNGSAQVSWTASVDGGSPVTGYSVLVYDGDVLVTTIPVEPSATSLTVPDLDNGTAYTFRVTASNDTGTSEASAPSAPVTPDAAPPVNDLRMNALPLPALPATVELDNSGATVEPDDLYGATIWYSYTPTATRSVTVTTAGESDTTLEVWDGSTAVADNDDDEQDETVVTSRLSFTALAGHTYLIGYGGFAGDSGSGTMSVTAEAGAPVAPAAPAAVPANGQVSLSWTAPDDNGSPVTGYAVRVYDGDMLVTTVPVTGATAATVTGLTNGTAYTFTVTATNAVGESPASASSVPVTPSPIQGRYQDMAAAAGPLGAPLAPEHSVGDGSVQDFAGGSLYWSPTTGVRWVQGAILAHYRALNGPTGLLGFPTSDETVTPGVAAGRVSTFTGGSVYWSSATGAWEVHGAIAAHYLELNGPAGFLGFPTSDEGDTVGAAGGRVNTFQGGAMYWSRTHGAHEVHGAIAAHYRELGGPAGLLGFPVTDETSVGAGRQNAFQNGTMFWSAATGAHEVHGANLQRYGLLGGPGGLLGFPLSDERTAPDGVGRYNLFTGGSIYWTPALGAHEVHGQILVAWAAGGYERGRLGYPVSDEYAVGADRRSDFTGGSVVWESATGRTTVVLR